MDIDCVTATITAVEAALLALAQDGIVAKIDAVGVSNSGPTRRIHLSIEVGELPQVD